MSGKSFDPADAVNKRASGIGRYSSPVGVVYRRIGSNVTAVEADPTIREQGVKKLLESPYASWVILMPAGVTSYNYKVWRFCEYKEGGDIIGEWALDEEVTGVTANETYIQPVMGDLLFLTITAITGAVGTGFKKLVKPVARQ